ncbi:uncharacterized protein LOC121917720 [Sceloporus undulatus]|uniref:uncharacterized protein LOC121917720 n=1 Tax=Sceloporus undulatus TaxID=8520 RepID=UPI001C4BD630|nr:uncharacterized protein LOC121917720 [Sceloporus undulatus]
MPRQWCLWTDEEVNLLFQLMEQTDGLEVIMGSSSLPNRAIYRRISKKMCSRGYNKTTTQVSSKVKVMRTSFYRAMALHGESPEEHQKPSYFEEMWHLWMMAGAPSQDLFAVAARRGRRARRPMQGFPCQQHVSPPHPQEGEVEEDEPADCSVSASSNPRFPLALVPYSGESDSSLTGQTALSPEHVPEPSLSSSDAAAPSPVSLDIFPEGPGTAGAAHHRIPLDDRVARLEEHLHSLDARVSQLEVEKRQQEAKNIQLEAENRQLKEDLKGADRRLDAMAGTITRAHLRMDYQSMWLNYFIMWRDPPRVPPPLGFPPDSPPHHCNEDESATQPDVHSCLT